MLRRPPSNSTEGEEVKDETRNASLIGLGYLLGRTKKGGAALRLYMWSTGNTGGPQAISAAKGVVGSVSRRRP